MHSGERCRAKPCFARPMGIKRGSIMIRSSHQRRCVRQLSSITEQVRGGQHVEISSTRPGRFQSRCKVARAMSVRCQFLFAMVVHLVRPTRGNNRRSVATFVEATVGSYLTFQTSECISKAFAGIAHASWLEDRLGVRAKRDWYRRLLGVSRTIHRKRH